MPPHNMRRKPKGDTYPGKCVTAIKPTRMWSINLIIFPLLLLDSTMLVYFVVTDNDIMINSLKSEFSLSFP